MALTKINSASITDATVVNADIADDTITVSYTHLRAHET